MYSVTIEQLKNEFSLELVTPTVNIAAKTATLPEINRPGLQFAGFFDYFEADRIQLIGLVEHTYMQGLDADVRAANIKKLFKYKFPCIVVCRGLDVFPEILENAILYDVPVLRCRESTTDFAGEVLRWLKVQLAPRVTMHGVFVDVYGEGILLIGESGIGKSETAMELIRRGHRLVADDAVIIRKVSNQTLIGSCPEVIRYFMELRGIGIIDVRQMFGVQSVKETQSIDLVIKLEVWDSRKEYDRLGMDDEYMEILGNNIVCHSIPIRPGRNLAIICESAAINYRQKKMGYNSAQALLERKLTGGTMKPND